MGEESKIEHAVTKYAKSQGYYARKFKSPNNRGVPDHLFLSPFGVAIFMEFKAPGRRATALQQREIDLINKNEGNAYVVDSIQKGREILNQFTE